ncbi:aminodeoxychorismate lyase [Marinomonas balearica]|uniref:Aminodeoxychorismate lyase n=1 Tax=Marinomonas balearica TaxID=491947 RepID=A0A4R6ME01_9GAMM|nr:aminodeoxychorismate lyase [Marinomonas balearica]TDO99981.1 aminodeoxychorismate lyase apoprotein [Marinomonas balearica]
MVWFVNFKKTENISINDRGLPYGDGLFETMLFQHGAVQNFQFHSNRLERGLRRLQFTGDFSLLLSDVWQFIYANAPSAGDPVLIKLIVTRGEGGRGYKPPNKVIPNVLIYFGHPPNYDKLRKQGMQLVVSPICTSINPSVAGLKHLNKLENVLAKHVLEETVDEALMLDPNGYITECIQSNIGWFKGNRLCLPSIVDSGVQGTMRSRIIESYNGVIDVGRFKLNDILEADEVFVCNGLLGVVGVASIVNQTKNVSKGGLSDLNNRRFIIGNKIENLQTLLEDKEKHVCC